ncbi:hypothetical protein D3C75_1239840 [compost metagenome]
MHTGTQQAHALADETGVLHGGVERGMGAVAREAQPVQRAAGVVQHIVRGTCRERQLERVAILVARNVLAHIAVPLRVTW